MVTDWEIFWPNLQKLLADYPIEAVVVNGFVVLVGLPYGAVIRQASPEMRAEDRMVVREDPPRLLLRINHEFLDREQELGTIGRALARGEAVGLHGAYGVGKTALVVQAMQLQLASAYSDGMVYISAWNETLEDLLQKLMACFFEIQGRVKFTENDLLRHMQGKRALIAVDDADHLSEDDVQAMVRAMPACSFLVAGQVHQLWEGQSVPLGGLPRDQAVALFKQRYPHITQRELPVVEAICDALGDVPLAVIKVATHAAEQKLTLPRVLQQVRSPGGKEGALARVFSLLKRRLSARMRRVLGGLVAPGGATVDIEALPEITGLPTEEIALDLAHLQREGLVEAHSPRYSVDDGLRPHILGEWVDREMMERTAAYYARQAGRLRGWAKDPDEENVLGALNHYYAHAGLWKEVICVVRAADTYLAATCRWGQWEEWLKKALAAAKFCADEEAEAWAQNQLGIIALGREDLDGAEKYFREALGIWRGCGQEAGITVADWNLQLLRPRSSMALVATVHSKPRVAKGKTIPIVARIAAGKPILAEENIEERMVVDDDLADRIDFGLRVRGDSMAGAGILDGDVVLVEGRPEPPPDGVIVAAIVEQMDEEATVKRYYREKDHIRLEPATLDYPLIIIKPSSVSADEIRYFYERMRPKRLLEIYSGPEPRIAGWVSAVIRETIR
jgi:SOS-response transcriptional repressor LexA